MSAPAFKRLLCRRLGYVEIKKSGPGSHCWLKSEGRPDIRWAFRDTRELAPIEVKRVLIEQAGLTIKEAREVYSRG